MVNAKQCNEVVSPPRIGNDSWAGTLTEEGCGCHKRGGPAGWETQDGGSGCSWAMATRTLGNFQSKLGHSTKEHHKPLTGGIPSSGYLEAHRRAFASLYLIKVRLGFHRNSTPAPDWQKRTKSGQRKGAWGEGGSTRVGATSWN